MDPVSLGSVLLVCKIILVVTQITILVVDVAIRFYS
jgi:hypothetical protein